MKCEECTMCCELLEIKELKKPAFTMCKFCKNGCSIHGSHPEECKKFECAYLQMENVNINLRPDKCKVVFEKLSDNIFFGTIHPDYELTLIARGQIKAFGQQGFSTIISSKFKKPSLFLAEGHTEQQIKEEFEKILKTR